MKKMKDERTKQISLVLEVPYDYGVLEFVASLESFVREFKGVEITGTHIKNLNNKKV